MVPEKTERIRILYAIQGTGNGHLARALTLIPELRKHAEVDVLLSGIQVDLELPFPVKYRLKGLSFIFGKKGGIDIWKMMRKVNLITFMAEIQKLKLKPYDLVLNDFEPVSAWACMQHRVPCIQFSHQAGVIQPEAPKPENEDWIGKWILKNYAPADHQFGFHFQKYNHRTFTPIIRDDVRSLVPTEGSHITVYLPAYKDDVLCSLFAEFKDVQWQIFSKHCKQVYQKENCLVQPIQNQSFIQSIASSGGVICGAGFETPAEVMHLNKKLLVVPMSHQYEQHCNAQALKEMGVKVLKNIDKESVKAIQKWLDNAESVCVNYPDNKSEAIEAVLTYANKVVLKKRFVFDFTTAKEEVE